MKGRLRGARAGEGSMPDGGSRLDGALGIAMMAGLAAVLAIVLVQPIRDLDLFWHLKHGDTILANRAIPRTDPFGFAVPDRPMCMNTWAADTLFAAIYRARGFTGLYALQAISVAATVAVLVWIGRRAGASLPVVVGWAALASCQASFRFLVRPLVFEFLFLAVWMWTIERYGRTRRLLILLAQPILAVLWSNAHGSYYLGPILSGLAAAGVLLDRARGRRGEEAPQPWIPLAAAGAVSLAACLVNPCGMEALTSPLRWQAHESSTGFAAENLPLSFSFVWYGGFAPVLALLAAAFLAPVKERKRGFDLLLAAFLAAITLVHWRFLGLLLLATIPAASRYLSLMARRGPRWAGAFVGLTLLALAVKDAVPRASEARAGLKADTYPERAADFLLSDESLGGKLFHNYDWGGYLLWRLSPRWRTFVDGRGHFFGPLLATYDRMLADEEAWLEADRRFGFDAVLFPLRPGAGLYGCLEREGGWALVYWDDLAVVFLKRKPAWAPIIERIEYRFVKPWQSDEPYASGAAAGALAETERNWRETQSATAALILSAQALKDGDPGRAEPVLRRALELHADAAALWNNLAVVEERTERLAGALGDYERAQALDPGHVKSLAGTARVLEKLGRKDEARSAYEKLLSIDPSSRIVREAIERLEKK